MCPEQESYAVDLQIWVRLPPPQKKTQTHGYVGCRLTTEIIPYHLGYIWDERAGRRFDAGKAFEAQTLVCPIRVSTTDSFSPNPEFDDREIWLRVLSWHIHSG